MILERFTSRQCAVASPRTRGDDPEGAEHVRPGPLLLPAPAGMILSPTVILPPDDTSPRTRGDDPPTATYDGWMCDFSPHPRG